MNKKELKEYFKQGGKIKVISPKSHKFFNIIREAEKIQTNALKFRGGSWLYFNDIKADLISLEGFKIDDYSGGFIEYIFINKLKEVKK